MASGGERKERARAWHEPGRRVQPSWPGETTVRSYGPSRPVFLVRQATERRIGLEDTGPKDGGRVKARSRRHRSLVHVALTPTVTERPREPPLKNGEVAAHAERLRAHR